MLLASVNHPNVAGVYGVEEVAREGASSGDAGPATQQLLVLE